MRFPQLCEFCFLSSALRIAHKLITNSCLGTRKTWRWKIGLHHYRFYSSVVSKQMGGDGKGKMEPRLLFDANLSTVDASNLRFIIISSHLLREKNRVQQALEFVYWTKADCLLALSVQHSVLDQSVGSPLLTNLIMRFFSFNWSTEIASVFSPELCWPLNSVGYHSIQSRRNFWSKLEWDVGGVRKLIIEWTQVLLPPGPPAFLWLSSIHLYWK